MSTDDENTSHLAEEQIERERARVYGRRDGNGARIDIRDRRVSSVIQWFYGAVGAAVVAGLYWVGYSITSLNVSLERALVRMDYQDKRSDLTEAEVRQLQKDVAEMQGKVYRGGVLRGDINEH